MPTPPRATFDNPYGPTVTFRTEDVLPPSAYYVTADDQIVIASITDMPGIDMFITLRFLTPGGDVKISAYHFPVTVVGSFANAGVISGVEGYIIGATVAALYPGLGRCYGQLKVVTGSVPAGSPATAILLQGYTSESAFMCYPPVLIQPMYTGPGFFSTITQSPAVGANFSFTVPNAARWRVESVEADYVTDATAGTRLPVLALRDVSNNRIADIPAVAPVNPGSHIAISWARGFPFASAGAYTTAPLPQDLTLTAGSQILGLLAAGGPADQWQNVSVTKEEWVGA